MSDIEIYNPVGKCKRCMGSGHVWKTVYLSGSMDGQMLVMHCPECNGTGKENISEPEKDM